MNVKQESLDIPEVAFKTESNLVSDSEQTLSRKHKCKREYNDVFDECETNIPLPEQNVDELKQEVIDCDQPKIEGYSELLLKIDHDLVPEKNLQFCNPIIKKEFQNISEVKTTHNIKEDISEYFFDETKSELLNTHFDLPTLKNENSEYPDCLAESSNNEQDEGTLSALEDFPASNSRSNHIVGDFQKHHVDFKICGKLLEKTDLQAHLKTHPNEKLFKCYICSKEFSHISKLNAHLIIHTNENPFKCDICSKKFNNKSDLKIHLIIHTNEKPFKCVICLKKFNHKSSLKKHLIIHTNEKPFMCEICSKGFKRKCDLSTHLITHTNEKPFKCEICSMEFTRKSSLKSHLIIHTNPKLFKCYICSKVFNKKCMLKSHLIKHTNAKSFKCDICSKSFNRKSDLSAHFTNHTNEKPFKCDICSKEFILKYYLNKHLKTTHPREKPNPAYHLFQDI